MEDQGELAKNFYGGGGRYGRGPCKDHETQTEGRPPRCPAGKRKRGGVIRSRRREQAERRLQNNAFPNAK